MNKDHKGNNEISIRQLYEIIAEKPELEKRKAGLLGKIINRLFGRKTGQYALNPSPLVKRLGEEVLDGKAILFGCKCDDVVYLAKRGIKPVIHVDQDSDSFKVVYLAKSIDDKLKLSVGKSDEVDLTADIVCVRSENPMAPTFMEQFLMKNAPYETIISDCSRLSMPHLNLLIGYAEKAVAGNKYLLLKNVGDKLLDRNYRHKWTEIACESAYTHEDYGLLLRKETDGLKLITDARDQLHRERYEKLGGK
jgi:hypothetical protein